MADPTPLHGSSLHDGVAALLRNRVFERALAPGSHIDGLALAALWQISRTPLRQARKVLAAGGLVTRVLRRGCRMLLAANQGRDPQDAGRAMHGHLMAQPAALKTLQQTETRRLPA